MSHLKRTVWKKISKGANGLQLRVRDLVRKFRPERVRWQLRHLLASVDQHWPPTIISTSSSSVDQIWPSATTDSTTTGPTDTAATATEAINPPFDNNIQKVVVVECEPQQTAESCLEQSPDQPMSTQVSVASPEEDPGRNGSVRPSELSIPVVGGSLVPPTASLTPRNKSPVTVQEWVDSLPLTPSDVTRGEEESEPRIVLTQDTDDNLTLGAEAGLMCGPLPPAVQVTSCREPSESGSHCSSVESLLEARKPDPEEVLLSLGFGGNSTSECRIPQRFLQPSRLRGVAIDDFLRHQHEMVQNFETGFCGYRGLSGPSHTMPSVIVAKIMEKLREHERESSAAASPPLASTNTDRNKFSRVARNVLTKIKCVPGNSVLTPDNRAWLDSQGHKSPEIGRKRIIIGQQSFTFSNDGDLIESQSPPSSLTDSDSRWTSSTGPGHHKTDLALDKPCVFPSIQEDLTEPPLPPTTTTSAPVTPKHAFANVVTTLLAEKHQESKLSSSSIEVSEEDKHWTRSLGDSGLPSSGRSSRGLEDCDSPVNLTDDKHSAPEPEHQTTVEGHLDSINEEVKPPREVVVEQSINPTTDVNEDSASDKVQQVLENLNSIPPNVTEFLNGKSKTLNVLNSHINISNKHVSLGLVDKTNSLDSAVENSSVAGRLLPASEQTSLPSSERSTLTTSPWPSLASELEQATAEEAKLESLTNCDVTSGEVSSPTAVRTEPLSAPGRVIESLDKVIESLEKIMEPLEVITESDNHMSAAVISQANRVKLLHSYDDLRLLVEQLLEVGVSLDVGSSDQFLSLTINERCALQSRVVRQALSAYQAQLASDSSHYQLKCCLGTEVLRLSDLLDSAADPDKLSTLVQQMTELLKHQAELSELLRSSVHEPHQLCEVVLRRLRALEDVVRRNTRDLTDLRKHV